MASNNLMKIPWAKPYFGGGEKKAVADAMRSTWISGGPYVAKFENEFARYHSVPHCITTSNGTSALQLALLGIGAGPGDEVIVPGFSFIAPANMTMAVGAKPVYADIDPHTWCMDPAAVERKISRRTKAIIVVHNYGNVCDMRSLRRIADRHKIFLIEDTAEALFSECCGKLAGTFGDVGCFSFQATKTITTGEGGCVLTRDKELERRMRLIRDHGLSRRGRYWHDVLGFNFRLTNLQAAFGCAQFRNRAKIISAKRRVYALYQKYLKNEKGIRFQCFSPEVNPVIWCVVVDLDPAVFGGGRDWVIKRLASQGIETRPGFYPPSVMPFYHAPRLPVAERVSARLISLPSFPLLTEREIRHVCDQLKKLRKKRS